MEIVIDFRNCEENKRNKMMECLVKLKKQGNDIDCSYSSQCNYICLICGKYQPHFRPTQAENIVNYKDYLKDEDNT